MKDIWSPQTVQTIHRDLFSYLPESDRTMTRVDESLVMQAGAWRTQEVSKG